MQKLRILIKYIRTSLCGKSLKEITARCVVSTSTVKYAFNSILEAIATCLGAKYAFGTSYALINRHLWQFIECGGYGFETHTYKVVKDFFKSFDKENICSFKV